MNSHWLFILLYIGGLIPVNTYLMKGYMEPIPMYLDESAQIAGAGNTRIFLQIILTLSKLVVAVAAMNGFAGPLGDFIRSSTILKTPEQQITLETTVKDIATEKELAGEITLAKYEVKIVEKIKVH